VVRAYNIPVENTGLERERREVLGCNYDAGGGGNLRLGANFKAQLPGSVSGGGGPVNTGGSDSFVRQYKRPTANLVPQAIGGGGDSWVISSKQGGMKKKILHGGATKNIDGIDTDGRWRVCRQTSQRVTSFPQETSPLIFIGIVGKGKYIKEFKEKRCPGSQGKRGLKKPGKK